MKLSAAFLIMKRGYMLSGSSNTQLQPYRQAQCTGWWLYNPIKSSLLANVILVAQKQVFQGLKRRLEVSLYLTEDLGRA